ncbi:MAG: 3-dehydroquinate synthase [Dehalococcoidia bacterium]|nr:3-dehydroquinate synthase [Dehalococcoidia bacterium]
MQASSLVTEIKSIQGNYPIHVGRDLINQIGSFLDTLALRKRVLMISDINIFSTFGIKIIKSLEAESIQCESLSLELNESSKNLSTVSAIYDWLLQQKAERTDVILAVGGGVATDLIGYVAATWLRGVKIIHIPTSLIGMVDAAVGGKTAVNITMGKNMVGAFHQPKGIIMDTSVLSSLPKREMISGWAEALKHAFLFDNDLLVRFEENSEKILAQEEPIFTSIIKKSVQIKAEIVSKDEFELSNERIKLNFGHTVGHALETITGYDEFLHGEAVSIGMVVASKISAKLRISDENLPQRICNALEKYSLPTTLPSSLDINDLYNICKTDKKVRGGIINWVLLENIGRPVVSSEIDDSVVLDCLKETQ